MTVHPPIPQASSESLLQLTEQSSPTVKLTMLNSGPILRVLMGSNSKDGRARNAQLCLAQCTSATGVDRFVPTNHPHSQAHYAQQPAPS